MYVSVGSSVVSVYVCLLALVVVSLLHCMCMLSPPIASVHVPVGTSVVSLYMLVSSFCCITVCVYWPLWLIYHLIDWLKILFNLSSTLSKILFSVAEPLIHHLHTFILLYIQYIC